MLMGRIFSMSNANEVSASASLALSSLSRYGRHDSMTAFNLSWWFSRNRADSGVLPSKGTPEAALLCLASFLSFCRSVHLSPLRCSLSSRHLSQRQWKSFTHPKLFLFFYGLITLLFVKVFYYFFNFPLLSKYFVKISHCSAFFLMLACTSSSLMNWSG